MWCDHAVCPKRIAVKWAVDIAQHDAQSNEFFSFASALPTARKNVFIDHQAQIDFPF